MEKTEKTESHLSRFIPMAGINRFPERLKIAMNGLNNVELAKRCDMSESAVRSYLNGRSYPGLDKILAISEACECPVDWLVTGNAIAIYNDEIEKKRDKQHTEEIDIVFSRLTAQEKKLIVDFVQREGLNSLLRLISGRPISHHKPQPLDFLDGFLDDIPDITDDNPDPNAPWVDEETRAQLKETLIEKGFNREKVSSLIMLFTLPAQEAREILAEYTSGKRASLPQGIDFKGREKKAKGG